MDEGKKKKKPPYMGRNLDILALRTSSHGKGPMRNKKENGLSHHEGAWVGLKAKGKATQDTSGFVVHDHAEHP